MAFNSKYKTPFQQYLFANKLLLQTAFKNQKVSNSKSLIYNGSLSPGHIHPTEVSLSFHHCPFVQYKEKTKQCPDPNALQKYNKQNKR